MDVKKIQNVVDARPLLRSPPQPTQSSAYLTALLDLSEGTAVLPDVASTLT